MTGTGIMINRLLSLSSKFEVHPSEFDLPEACVLFFGQEGTGLSPNALASCQATVSIAQYGSTRSINVGAAAAIAMHAWIRRHEFGQVP